MNDQGHQDVCVVISSTHNRDRLGYISYMDAKTFKRFKKRRPILKVTVTWIHEEECVVSHEMLKDLRYEYETLLSTLLSKLQVSEEQGVFFCPFLQACEFEFPQFFDHPQDEHIEFVNTFCFNEKGYTNCSEYCYRNKQSSRFPPV